MNDQVLPFPVEAIAVTVRRDGSNWTVDVRRKRECDSWELAERYTELCHDEALDVAFCSLGAWD